MAHLCQILLRQLADQDDKQFWIYKMSVYIVYIVYILIILLGLAVGSFLNVVILRFDDIKSIWRTRSHCMKCKKQIAWYDLIPFFSYLILRGKCRYCKKDISIQYPVIEAVTAIIFVGIYW